MLNQGERGTKKNTPIEPKRQTGSSQDRTGYTPTLVSPSVIHFTSLSSTERENSHSLRYDLSFLITLLILVVLFGFLALDTPVRLTLIADCSMLRVNGFGNR